MSIYFFKDELEPICKFLGADVQTVLDWFNKNKDTCKYVTFERISGLGQLMYTLTYGKHLKSTQEIICQVSGFGTHFQENQNGKANI